MFTGIVTAIGQVRRRVERRRAALELTHRLSL